MVAIRVSALLVLCATLSSACGSSGNSKNQAPAKSELEGTWTQACGSDSNGGTYNLATKTVSGSTVNLSATIFSDAACTQKLLSVVGSTSFSIGAPSSAQAGAKAVDYGAPQELSATYLTDSYVAAANSGEGMVCNGGFKIGVAKTIKKADCPNDAVFRPQFDIFKISGNQLYGGKMGDSGSNSDGSTAAKRPTELETRPFVKSGSTTTAGAPQDASLTCQNGGGKLIIDYQPTTTYAAILQVMKGGIVEDMADVAAKTFCLPADIPFHVMECGQPNAFYDPAKKDINYCYEFLKQDYDLLANSATLSPDQRANFFNGAFYFASFHELGHAMIDLAQVPITGREEDVADQVATATLINANDDSNDIAINAALSAGQTLVVAFPDGPASDVHSLSTARLTNIYCWVYGSNPAKLASLVSPDESGALPPSRAQSCPSETSKMVSAIGTLFPVRR